jgi:phosphoglycolate phosphatase-like HAD superfamily hydrolase
MAGSGSSGGCPLYVFDFDGVVCDSARETGISAWRAGRRIWPEWSSPDPPEECLARFCELRPYLETGYQAVGVMRLACQPEAWPEPLNGDTIANWVEGLYHRLGRSRQEMVGLFGQARDHWIANDAESWFDSHGFFPGLPQLLNRLVLEHPVHVLSTKQVRFIRTLLQRCGVELPGDRIIGLESGLPKEDSLRRLLRESGDGVVVHFLEDRLETLERVASCPDLDPVRLYLADWGYNTPEQCRRAKQSGRISLVGLANVASVLGG